MMTSQVLRALERRGLVSRMPHPQDGRARALAVSADGRDLANRAVAAVEACDLAFFQPLGAGVGSFAQMLLALRAGAGRQAALR